MASYKVKTDANTWTEYFKSYESKSAASGGTALSLVTTGEKYTWNNKASTSSPTFTGTIDASGATLKIKTINAPTASGGTSYGAGTNGYVLKSNGTTIYWASDSNSTSYLSYTPTSVTDSSTTTTYLVGKQSTGSTGTNYYNLKVYYKGSKLYSNNSEVLNLADAQSITGVKKFIEQDGAQLITGVDGTNSTQWTQYSALNITHFDPDVGSSCMYSFPSSSGTIALTKQIPNVTPNLAASATASSNKFVFNLGTSSSAPNLTTGGGLGVFSFGNCNTILSLYKLTSGTTYKTVGTFIYDSSGSVVTTTINYKYTKNSTTNTLEIWSGNSDKKIQNSYTGYLFLVKLT